MTELDNISTLLHAAADAFDPPAPPDPARLAALAGRRRGAQRTTTATLAVLALLATVSVSIRWRQDMATTRPTAGATVGDLKHYHWSNLPTAPIEPRTQAAVGWTGREMVVWGGVSHDGHIFGDGAAFDPARSTWRRIADASNLPPRYGATALWTGTELLVVGGQTAANGDSRNGVTPAGPSAAYDPATDRWRPLPAGPADTEHVLAAAWTGSEVVAVTSERSTAAYDPATGRWRSLPAVPEPPDHDLLSVVPVWTGAQLVTWVLWAHADSPAPGSEVLSSGIDLFTLDPATGDWTPRPGHGERPIGVSTAAWTGHDVVLPVAGVWRGYSSGPSAAPDRHGLRYDPATDTYTPMAHGPLDDGDPPAYWTGVAVLTVSQSQVQGAGQDIEERDTAAWDPVTDRWTRLDRAPAGVTYESTLLWTGRELLAYGAQPTRFG